MGTWESCIAMGNKKVDYSNWPIYILIKRFLSILSKMAGAGPLSPEAIEERAQVRSKLKAYFLKNIHDPFRHGSAQGEFLFEPGLMRYNAMLVTKYDYFNSIWSLWIYLENTKAKLPSSMQNRPDCLQR